MLAYHLLHLPINLTEGKYFLNSPFTDYNLNIYYIQRTLEAITNIIITRAFLISVSRWFFTGVWVTAILLTSPGLFLVF